MKPGLSYRSCITMELPRLINASNLSSARSEMLLKLIVSITRHPSAKSSPSLAGASVFCLGVVFKPLDLSVVLMLSTTTVCVSHVSISSWYTDINSPGPEIYKILGIDNSTSLMIIGISGSLSIVYCTVGLWALERFGRVKPLIISAAGLGAALVCNAAMSQTLDPNNGNMLRAMVAMNFVFSLFYTPLGIISWVYPAEIFPVEVRAFGNATTTFTNWVLNLIFAQFSPQALKSIGFRYFYVFFVFNMIAMVCYIFFYPGKLYPHLVKTRYLLTDFLQKPRVRRWNRWMSFSVISWFLML
jgi:hypothetical protein